MDRLAFGHWLDRYVDGWKTYSEEAIGKLFSEDARYRYHPWDNADETVSGREQIVANWLANRDRPDSWAAEYHPWVTDGGDAVAVGVSRYLGPDGVTVEREYHNVFLCRFDAEDRCTEFTEYFMRRPD
jgi:SnoaL-like domain